MASKRKLKIQIKGAKEKEKKKRSNSTGCLAGLSGLAQCAHTLSRQEALLRPAQELDLHFHYTHTRGILLPTYHHQWWATCIPAARLPFFLLLIHVSSFVSSVYAKDIKCRSVACYLSIQLYHHPYIFPLHPLLCPFFFLSFYFVLQSETTTSI